MSHHFLRTRSLTSLGYQPFVGSYASMDDVPLVSVGSLLSQPDSVAPLFTDACYIRGEPLSSSARVYYFDPRGFSGSCLAC